MKKVYLSLFLALGLMACGNSKAENAGNEENEALQEQTNLVETKTYDVADGKIIPTNGLPTIVDFSATWCPPCRQLKPIFEALKEEYKGKVNFVTIDVDENPQISTSYGVQNIPTMVFINPQGNELTRTIGFQDRDQIINVIDTQFKI